MRGIVTEVKKEGFVLVAFYEFNRFQIQTVGQVLVFAHPVFGKIEPAWVACGRRGARKFAPLPTPLISLGVRSNPWSMGRTSAGRPDICSRSVPFADHPVA